MLRLRWQAQNQLVEACCIEYYAIILPIRGLAEVMGMMLCTVFRNMVIDSSMVTPVKLKVHYYAMSDFGPGVLACATGGGGRSEAGHCFHLLFSKRFSCSPKDSFSPESGGRVKSSTAMDDMSKQGTIRL